MKNKNLKFVSIITFIIFLAFLIRIWGIGAKLPYLYNSDTVVDYENILSVALNTKPNYDFFSYPPLFFNIEAGFYKLFFLINAKPVHIQSISPGNAFIKDTNIFLFGSIVNLLLSLGIVALVFVVSLEITGNLHASLFASLLSGFSPISVLNSRLITPDILSGLMTTLVLYFSLLILRRGKMKFYIIAGALTGFTIGAKYNALVFVMVLVSHLLRTGFKKFFLDKRIYISILFILLGFIVSSPQIFLERVNYMKGFARMMFYHSSPYPGVSGNSLLFYLTTLIKRETVGFISLLIALVILWKYRSKPLIIILIFICIYIIFMSNYSFHSERNLIPVLGPLFVVSAIVFDRMFGKFKVLIIVLLLIFPLYASIVDTKNLIHDERASARNWIDNNIVPGSHILVESYGPWIDPDKFKVHGLDRLIDLSPLQLRASRTNYMVASRGEYGRYFDDPKNFSEEAELYKYLFNNYEIVREFKDGESKIKVLKVLQ